MLFQRRKLPHTESINDYFDLLKNKERKKLGK